jgi:predicted nucleic acid-binding protein
MNGIKYFVDTNAVIALLGGNQSFEQKLSEAEWVGFSVVSAIEFLSFTGLSERDKISLEIFISRIKVVGILNDLPYLESVARFKAATGLKLPDALIAYAAIEDSATLISNDKHFQNINGLSLLTF